MKATAQERTIAGMIEPAIADLGFELVQVRLIGSQKLQTLQIMAEDPATGRLDLNGCTAISRSVSAILDVEDPIASAYQLEVSSPGMDRPLTRASDFDKFKGEVISVETEEADQDGQKKFRGTLTDFSDNVATLITDTGEVKLDIAHIVKAKLVLTEERIKAALKQEIKE